MSAPYPLPPIQVNVGFASNPLDIPQVWTDISHLVKAVKTTRGRQHTLNRFEPGTLTVTCFGNDRALDPFNSSGPYWPNIDANKQIQVLCYWNLLTAAQAGGTLDWVTSPISSGWTAGAHTSVSYSTYLLLTGTATGGMSAQTPTGTSAAYAFVQPGNLYTGMASVWAGNAHTVTPGTVRSCSITLFFYNAAGTFLNSITSSQANDSNATSGGLPVWTTYSVQTVAPAGAVYASLSVQTTASAVSDVQSVQQPAIFPAVGVGPIAGAIPGVAPPGGAVPLFTGFIDQVNPVWTDNLNTDIQITATDSMRLLDTDTVLSPYQDILINLAPAAHSWPLGDAPGTLTASDIIGTGFPFAYQGGYTLDQVGPSFTDASTAVLFDGLSGHAVVDTSGASVSGPIILDGTTWEVNFWFNSDTIPALGTSQSLYSQPSTSATSFLSIALANTYGTAQVSVTFGTTGSPVVMYSPAAVNYADGNWHFCSVILTAGANLGLIMDADTVVAFANGVTPSAHAPSSVAIGGPATASMYGGPGNGIPGFFAGTMAYLSVWNGSLCSQRLALIDFGNTGFPLTDTLTRATLVMQGLQFQPSGSLNPPSSISLPGYSLIQQPSGDLTQSSVLSHLQDVEKTENGFLYTDASGILRFLNRYAPITGVRVVSLGTLGENEVAYLKQPDAGLDNMDLYTQSVVARQGGLNQTASAGTQIQYGVASALVETGLLVMTDAECLNRAQWNVQTYGQTTPRVRSVDIDPLGDPTTRFPMVLYREVMDRVTFKRRPYGIGTGFGSPAFVQDQYIEGVTHDIDKQTPSWKTTYNLYPSIINAPLFIIGDAVNGVIGTSQIGY